MTIYDLPPLPPPSHPLLCIIVNLLVLTRGISSVAGARLNRTCGQLHDDVPSRTALAPVVFEGRAQRAEPLPSWAGQIDREHFNVTFKPRTLYKGSLPRSPEGGFSVITVGTFGVAEDRNACVPSVQLRSRYIVFLRGDGSPSDYNGQLSFYEIFSFPEPFSPEGASLAAEYACANCTSLPTATLAPNEVEAKQKQRLPLRCTVTGRPFPVVTWYKDGRELTAEKRFRLRKTKSGSSLRINKVRTEDAGSYYCIASNVLAEVQSNISLVSVAPEVTSFKSHAVLCSTQTYCLNGGVCYTIPTLGRKFCECDRTFSGIRCQDREVEPWRRLLEGQDKLKLETLLIAAILVIVVLLLLTLLCIFCAVCRMQGKYSKVLLNSSRSKQSLRLDRMVALATANHLPSYCDTSVQTDPVATSNRLPNDISTTTNCGQPVTNKYNACVATRRDKQACSTSAPAACGVSIAPGCVATAACGKPSNSASGAAAAAAVHHRHSKVIVSNGGVQYSGNKANGCIERLSTGVNATGCKRPSSGATVTKATVAKACNPRLSSPPDCGQTASKPACTIVTVATIVTEPSKRESCCVSTVTGNHNPPTTSENVKAPIECTRESSNHAAGSTTGCSVAPCSDGRSSGCKATENGLVQSQASKRNSGNCSKRSSAVECGDAAGCQQPKTEDSDEKQLQIVSQEEEVLCPMKADLLGSSPPIPSQRTKDSSPPPPPPTPPPVSNKVNGDCDKSLHPCFTFDIPPSGCAPVDKHQDLDDSECLNFDPKEVGHHHHHHRHNQRSVHTVPKHGFNSGAKQNVLSERCSSDYERNSPASDLEVNMESEVDIQALNASEEELGRDLGRSRLFFHNNYESSVDTTDSESSLSSHEHDQLLIDRLKSQHCSRPMMESSTEENAVVGGGCPAPVELDWEKFSCPFNFTALDHTFTLNPYDIIYANKYLARNQSKTDGPEEEGVNGEAPLPGVHDQYPYDPDPDATVV